MVDSVAFIPETSQAPNSLIENLRVRLPAMVVAIAVWTLMAGSSCADAPDPPQDGARIEFFEKKIRPLLIERCGDCHGPDEQEASLRLDGPAGIRRGGDQGAPFVSGDPNASLLVRGVRYQDERFQMPPDGKLADEEIRLLEDWIRQGAAMPAEEDDDSAAGGPATMDFDERKQHWAYQPIRSIAPPANTEWARSPIDAFIEAGHREHGLTPVGPADPLVLLRRLTIDLTGLPATPTEVEEFTRDARDDRLERWGDRLLASPHYGERWGRHWLDLVRFAETLGHEFDYDLFHAWRYRDYVVRSLNADLPYDTFVREHIAGDLVQPPRLDPVTGTVESVIGPAFFWFGEATHSPVDIRQAQADRIDNQIDVMSKAFLAQSIACARCHDHKFDAIRQADYYALAGFLKSSCYEQVPIDSDNEHRQQVDRLATLREQCDSIIQRQIPNWQRQLSAGQVDLNALPSPEGKPSPTEPFYSWHALKGAEANWPAAIEDVRQSLDRQRQQFDEWSQASIRIDVADPAGWTTRGSAFDRPTSTLFRLIREGDGPVQLLGPRIAVVDSSHLSRQLEGTIRSRTFTLDRDYVHIKAAGLGTRINLVIDGFNIIRDPIYGGLLVNLTDPRLSWKTIDVRKWRGHAACLELIDASVPNLSQNGANAADGYFELEQVALSDSPSVVEPASSVARTVLAEPSPTSVEELRDRYKEALSQALTDKSATDIPTDDASRDRARLLRSALSANCWPVLDDDGRAELEAALNELTAVESALARPRYVPGFVDGSGQDEFIFIRGNYRTLAEESPRRFLEVIDGPEPLSTGVGSGRLALADRVTDADNPLFARVIVNRLWQHHLGAGIVASPDDFGKMGQLPTNPELLDWLADEFRKTGYSLKHMHRQLIATSTYRLSSESSPELEAKDPKNERWARRPMRRLEAEIIRDKILAVSGRLDLAMEGPGVYPHLTPFMPTIGRPGTSGPLDGAGRRSLYLMVRRNFLEPLLLAFDYPLPQTTIGRRNVSNVPTQALAMLNDPFVMEQARHWSARVIAHADHDSERIDFLYRSAYGRPATAGEQAKVASILEALSAQDGANEDSIWTSFCHTLMNTKEFLFIP